PASHISPLFPYTTLFRSILGLLKPDGGRIFVNGRRVDDLSEVALMDVRAELGMVFQESALFDSFTVRENVGYRLYEETNQPIDEDRKSTRLNSSHQIISY